MPDAIPERTASVPAHTVLTWWWGDGASAALAIAYGLRQGRHVRRLRPGEEPPPENEQETVARWMLAAARVRAADRPRADPDDPARARNLVAHLTKSGFVIAPGPEEHPDV